MPNIAMSTVAAGFVHDTAPCAGAADGPRDRPARPRRLVRALALVVSLVAPGLVPGLAGGPAKAEDVVLEEVLRCQATDQAGIAACAEARELVIFYCTSCHTFAPIVMQQFDKGGWSGLLSRHRGWIPNVTDEDFAKIGAYLAENFNPDLPPPELPQELLDTWTSY